ncbi:2-dehydropantoate 2-reductase [hydrothermal vent metagenome]|uniref:2-dehydropantoate 2-reductase n=1 Tax=hydrothermal vent metagenome TaxID=652676 RepID=A0A3B1D3B0_9ZZZZ
MLYWRWAKRASNTGIENQIFIKHVHHYYFWALAILPANVARANGWPNMKILIVGSGGVGGFYGGALARKVDDVFFIARGANLEAILKNGLTIKSVDGEFTITPDCGANGEGFGVADLVIVCVKAYDTQKTLGLYRQNVGPGTTIISLQNGIDNEGIIAREYGKEKVMGAVAFVGSRVEEPGVILHSAFGHIAIGELGGEVSKRAKTIRRLFVDAGVKCKISENIIMDIWGKMIWNTGFNAITAILGVSAKEAASNEGIRQTIHGAMMEWIEVAKASGVSLWPELADKNIAVTLKGGDVIPSMLQDRRSGRQMEIDIINGKAAQLGRTLGIPTPINDTIVSIVSFMNNDAKPA